MPQRCLFLPLLLAIFVLAGCNKRSESDSPHQPVDPNNASAFIERGNAWCAKKDFDNAIKDFTEAIRLDPNNALGFSNRGGVWYYKKDYVNAIKDFTEAIRLDPKNANWFRARGNSFLAMKDYDNAIDDYTEAIRLDPKDALSFSNRGEVWSNKNDHVNAIKDFTEGIRLDPKNANWFVARGNSSFLMKDYDNAINDFTAAIRLDPKYALAFAARAMVLATSSDANYRDGEKALEDAQKACELSHWENMLCVSTLAAAYAERGEFDEALKWEKKVLADKDYEKAHGNQIRKRLKLYESKKPYRL